MKFILRLVSVLGLLLCGLCVVSVAFAQDAAPVVAPPAGTDFITQFIVGFASTHPWLVTVASIMGAFRLLFKPIMGAIEAYVKSTPTTADDAFFETVEHSGTYKALAWCLDWFGSVKIGPQFTAKPEGPTVIVPPAGPAAV
jgi:hypothetical protein